MAALPVSFCALACVRAQVVRGICYWAEPLNGSGTQVQAKDARGRQNECGVPLFKSIPRAANTEQVDSHTVRGG